jgi:predicted MFS family arabinose efflux permease
MVGASFGLARYGYGLLLPEMRGRFDLSSAAFGLIATGSYAAYLVGTFLVGAFGDRFGPRPPVVLGGAMAVAGMALLAVADSPAALATGVLIAGASAAVAYPPFSDAVVARVDPARRARALAWISCGTGWGVALAVPIALAVGSRWQVAWAVFAGLAVVATIFAAVTLGGRQRRASAGTDSMPSLSWSWFVCPRSGPLLVGALLVGVGASVYWTFGADFVSSGELAGAAGPVLLGVVGVASVLGSFGGDFLERVGGRRALQISGAGLALSLCSLALLHESWLVLLSAAAFGTAYNLVLAVQVIWSARVFESRPGTGLAAVLFMLGIGQLIGPPLAGVLADGVGLAAAFYGGGALIALTVLLTPREELSSTGDTARGRPPATTDAPPAGGAGRRGLP